MAHPSAFLFPCSCTTQALCHTLQCRAVSPARVKHWMHLCSTVAPLRSARRAICHLLLLGTRTTTPHTTSPITTPVLPIIFLIRTQSSLTVTSTLSPHNHTDRALPVGEPSFSLCHLCPEARHPRLEQPSPVSHRTLAKSIVYSTSSPRP
jgi:hypothetical protein